MRTLREARAESRDRTDVPEEELVARGWQELVKLHATARPARQHVLRRVTVNREVEQSVVDSRKTVKADAAIRVFDLDCQGIAWAVIDSGVDARHPAFRRRNAAGKPYATWTGPGAVQRTRIVATYDMTRLRSAQRLLQGDDDAALQDPAIARLADEQPGIVGDLRDHLADRRPLDWALLEPLLRVPHRKKEYRWPVDDHGTHVAGILAGDWPTDGGPGTKGPLAGLCPRLELYDLRVFRGDGRGDEFALAAALQFVDHLNGYGRRIRIAGANVSLSLRHDMSFGCGQTPACQEANRLVAGGVVVVAAAGNRGSEEYAVDNDFERTLVEGYRMVSLTDPGNAEDVITVGSTHATNPHGYGVSYFSSRGPTGDGRNKPDLVAPGEKIEGPAVGGGRRTMDGTSQAAPHVSGAAALLLARHRELIGKPLRVKELLMRSATDLGREPYFQGAGLVDVLRTTQAV